MGRFLTQKPPSLCLWGLVTMGGIKPTAHADLCSPAVPVLLSLGGGGQHALRKRLLVKYRCVLRRSVILVSGAIPYPFPTNSILEETYPLT